MNPVIPLILVFCVAATRGASKEVVEGQIAKSYQECSSKFPFSSNDKKMIEKKEVPNSRNAKCFMACGLVKARVMKGRQISVNDADGALDFMFTMVPIKGSAESMATLKTLVKRTTNDCAVKANQGNGNKCEKAYQMCGCMYTAAKQMVSIQYGG